MKLDFHHGVVKYLLVNGWLDHWTALHCIGGVGLVKIALWCGANNFEAVMFVAIIGLLWEAVEWLVEKWKPYGSKRKWRNNTLSDLIVEIGLAILIVL